MQGFWVRVDDTHTTGQLVFTNSMRYHKDANPLKAPAAKNADNQILRIQVAGGTRTDEAVVYFNTNAANGYDTYDSPKMLNGISSTLPDIYTLVGTEKLVINGMNNIPYNTEIPLYFNANASTATSFTLTASEISNFETGTPVYIKNNLTGEQQLISDGSAFTFASSAIGTNPAFSLILKAPGSITGLTQTDNQNILVYANSNQQIIVSSKSVVEYGNVTVYNAVVQKLFAKQLTGNITVLNNSLSSGIYFVTVDVAGNKTTKKVIINE
jgi:hypothetical protein